jgi:hypothetical protein
VPGPVWVLNELNFMASLETEQDKLIFPNSLENIPDSVFSGSGLARPKTSRPGFSYGQAGTF